MTEDYRQRSALVAYRVFFVYGGMVGCVVLGFGLFFAPTAEFANGQLNGVVYGPMVAGFGFVSVWCFSRRRLTRERHGEILRVLARRRQRGGGEPRTAAPPEGAA